MPVARINFTGRKRLAASDIGIKLFDALPRPWFEVTNLSLDRHSLPEDSLLSVEAYRQSSWMRFDLGTIAEPVIPKRLTLNEFLSPDGILFRLKVTSSTNPEGRLLAAGDRIRPEFDAPGQISLLPVRGRS